NEVRTVITRLVDRRRIFIADAVIESEILTRLPLILPVEVPGVAAQIADGFARADAGGVDTSGGEICEVDEVERAAHRAVQIAPPVFAADLESPSPRMRSTAGRRDVREGVRKPPSPRNGTVRKDI